MTADETYNKTYKTILFTDLVGSVAMKSRLGEAAYARAITEHDLLFHQCFRRQGGVEQQSTGDGFFATFDLPSNALACALAFQQGLAALELPTRLGARVGIHMGEIMQLPDGDQDPSQYHKLVGLAIDTAARLMGLAQAHQILLTRRVFDDIRQEAKYSGDGASLKWLAHGPYHLKGQDEPIEVFEVGIEGLSPLSPPPDSEKARRVLAPGEEETLGWRPAVGLPVPYRPGWCLVRKLGEGGFGEVWLGENRAIGRAVFKFCFKADRLRALKREAAVVMLIKKDLGEHPNIARILDCQLDQPPFCLISEYTDGGSLIDWAQQHGGIEKVPVDVRLDIVAQIARALAEAHHAGILHRDVKPPNILIGGSHRRPVARLADFGIGLINQEVLAEKGLSPTATLASAEGPNLSSGSGSLLYMAPELLEGKSPTTRSDIYSLGVVLYQMVAGDLGRAVGVGWEADVDDQLLRDDIAVCIARDPGKRLSDAAELADRLRGLETRREQRRAAEEARRRLMVEKARRRRAEQTRYYLVVALLACSLVGALLAALEFHGWNNALKGSENLYVDHVLRANLTTAHWLAQAVERKLTISKQAVERLANDEEPRQLLRRGDRAAVQAWIEKVKEVHGAPLLAHWALASNRGIILGRAPYDASIVGKNYSYRDWFSGGLADGKPIRQTRISEPYLSKDQCKTRMVGISAPVWESGQPLAADDQPLGVLVGTITLEGLAEWFRAVPKLRAPRSTASADQVDIEVAVLNDRDQLVYHRMNPLIEGDEAKVYEWPNAATVLEGDSGTVEAYEDPLAKRTYSMAYCRVPAYRWVVLVMEDHEAALQPLINVTSQVRHFGWGTVVIALVVLAFLLIRLLTRIMEKRAASGLTAQS